MKFTKAEIIFFIQLPIIVILVLFSFSIPAQLILKTYFNLPNNIMEAFALLLLFSEFFFYLYVVEREPKKRNNSSSYELLKHYHWPTTDR